MQLINTDRSSSALSNQVEDRNHSSEEKQNLVSILSFGTALPDYSLSQEEIGKWMANAFTNQRAVSRMVRSLHAHSGIDRRYSCSPEYLQPTANSRFTPGSTTDRQQETPTTAERMTTYAREAPSLGKAAAACALEKYAATSHESVRTIADSVTHLIVVSCTGFFAPGLDFVIAQQLGLPANVSRTLIGFMGCSAAFNGLHIAQQIVRSQPNARVLVVCVELCSLHIQQNTSPAHLTAMSLFADGAAACLVGEARADETDLFRLDAFRTETQPDTESAMVWEIGNHGFMLHLSPQIPEHVAEAAPAVLQRLFGGNQPHFWAIHPGGRAIVDRLEKIFALSPEQVMASRTILQRYGNLSSATILFVLEEMQQTLAQQAKTASLAIAEPVPSNPTKAAFAANELLSGVAMAFGPGLVIEMARLTYIS